MSGLVGRVGVLEAGSKKVTSEWVVCDAVVFTTQQYIYVWGFF